MPQTNNDLKGCYRPNVGLMILNADFNVLMGHRIGKKLEFPYQMPQGGIDDGETPVQAAWRELYEETGLSPKECDLICETTKWYFYDIPETSRSYQNQFKGQKQKWFLFLLKKECRLDTTHQSLPEFSDFKWVAQDLVCDIVVPFKKEVYKNVFKEFSPVLSHLSSNKKC